VKGCSVPGGLLARHSPWLSFTSSIGTYWHAIELKNRLGYWAGRLITFNALQIIIEFYKKSVFIANDFTRVSKKKKKKEESDRKWCCMVLTKQ
jgi:hypothetical protein